MTPSPRPRRCFLAPVTLGLAFIAMNVLDKRFPGAIWLLEAMLAERFESDYAAYRGRVRRWI